MAVIHPLCGALFSVLYESLITGKYTAAAESFRAVLCAVKEAQSRQHESHTFAIWKILELEIVRRYIFLTNSLSAAHTNVKRRDSDPSTDQFESFKISLVLSLSDDYGSISKFGDEKHFCELIVNFINEFSHLLNCVPIVRAYLSSLVRKALQVSPQDKFTFRIGHANWVSNDYLGLLSLSDTTGDQDRVPQSPLAERRSCKETHTMDG